jgi:hypothetical protein
MSSQFPEEPATFDGVNDDFLQPLHQISKKITRRLLPRNPAVTTQPCNLPPKRSMFQPRYTVNRVCGCPSFMSIRSGLPLYL